MSRWARMLALVGIALTLGSAVSQATGDDKAVLRLRAFAMNLNGGRGARTGTLDIVVERWSTDEDRDQLRSMLIEKGSDALLKALQKLKPRAGFIRSSTSLGWDIQYAREQVNDDGSRRIIIATDRPLTFWELANKPRSADYEFTLAEIRLSKEGKGEGKLVPAAKITWNQDKRTIEIENYSNEPVRLSQVEVQGSKK
jgi:hypothetical protein